MTDLAEFLNMTPDPSLITKGMKAWRIGPDAQEQGEIVDVTPRGHRVVLHIKVTPHADSDYFYIVARSFNRQRSTGIYRQFPQRSYTLAFDLPITEEPK